MVPYTFLDIKHFLEDIHLLQFIVLLLALYPIAWILTTLINSLFNKLIFKEDEYPVLIKHSTIHAAVHITDLELQAFFIKSNKLRLRLIKANNQEVKFIQANFRAIFLLDLNYLKPTHLWFLIRLSIKLIKYYFANKNGFISTKPYISLPKSLESGLTDLIDLDTHNLYLINNVG